MWEKNWGQDMDKQMTDKDTQKTDNKNAVGGW